MRRVVVLGIVLAGVLTAPAGATLVYSRPGSSPQLTAHVYAAADDGSGARRIAAGYEPQVSPDGRTVVFRARRPGSREALRTVPAAGGASRTLASSSQPVGARFSPDSTRVAAEIDGRRLAVFDLATGARTDVARGSIQGLSWSPAGTTLVYGRAESASVGAPSDLYSVPAAGGAPRRLTRDQRSIGPVWGRRGIAYVKEQRRPGDAPRYDVWLRPPRGAADRQLTHVPAGPLVSGLVPVDFSADGSRLLALFVGTDTGVGYAVSVASGRARALSPNVETGLVGVALSADGRTILAQTGGLDPSNHHDVVAVPFGGGGVRVLARGGSTPAWSR